MTLYKSMAQLVALFSMFAFMSVAQADVKEYDIVVETKTVNYTGEDVEALTLGGGIPGPTIKATLGDTLRVTFHNKMDVETSIHWHGILLPHEQDGVPWLNTVPIAPRSSHTFEFPIIHAGTYWYHSHTGLQEQRGVYGSIVLEDPNENRDYDHDLVLVFSDWTNENPDDILRNLKRDGDYYALKKDSVQSWDKVIANGMPAIKSRLQGSWTRMGPMDLSDVGYDAFLANGEIEHILGHAMPGDRVRVRMINAAASSYFNVEFAGGPMEIIALDGMDIQPQPVKRFRMAIAETWDAIVTIPEEGGLFEFRATANDGTGYASAFVGMGEKVMAPDIPRPNLFVQDHSMHDMSSMAGMDHGSMDHGSMDHAAMGHDQSAAKPEQKPMLDHSNMDHGSMDHAAMGPDQAAAKPDQMPEMDHSTMDHSQMVHAAMGHSMPPMTNMSVTDLPPTIDYLTDYAPLKAVRSTVYPADMPERLVELSLTGNMEKYIWSFNDKTLSEADKILIRKGEKVRFRFVNTTMMNHPLHLHGHFFRVLNGQGDLSPLKHTVNVPSMGVVEIEFAANEEADWFFHCHNLYHMKAGMTRVISYEETTKADESVMKKLFTDNHWYAYADVGIATHMSEGRLWTVNNRYLAEVEWEAKSKDRYEVEAKAERFFGRYVEGFVGVKHESHEEEMLIEGDILINGFEKKTRAFAGVNVVLPLLIEGELRVDHKGDVRIQFGSELQLSDKTSFEWMWNSDDEYELGLEYAFTKRFSLTAGHNNKYGTGAGFMVKF